MSSGVQEQSSRVLASRWQLEPHAQPIGEGAFAHTFAGVDLHTGALIAVKVLKQNVPAGARDRFLREMQIHAQLEHPAIINLLDHGCEDDLHFIVMPRMAHGSVADVVQSRGPLSPAKTLHIGRRVADALVYLRSCEQTHGDISPGNILLDGEDQAFLADFGFSKVVESVPQATTGDRYGTPGFRAPRPDGERRTYDDDVFSLAAVLWFCLTAQTPDETETDPLRQLRIPLERALRWRRVPTAERFRDSIERRWSKLARDWEGASTPAPRRGRPALAALLGLAAVATFGQTFQAEPADPPHTPLQSADVMLRLDGRWQQRQPPALLGIPLHAAISASRADTQVAAGLTHSDGGTLLGRRALEALPLTARTPRRVTIDDRAFLRYGPAREPTGLAMEILAMPLARRALIIWCEGAVTGLSTTCAHAAAGAEALKEPEGDLAPEPDVAFTLREAIGYLDETRRKSWTRMAASDRASAITHAAAALPYLYRTFASALESATTGAQDRPAVAAVAAAARRTAVAYGVLSRAMTDADWRSARRQVLARERTVNAALDHLRSLGYVP
jgi:hypothetical protein